MNAILDIDFDFELSVDASVSTTVDLAAMMSALVDDSEPFL